MNRALPSLHGGSYDMLCVRKEEKMKEKMSLCHKLYPNISISLQPDGGNFWYFDYLTKFNHSLKYLKCTTLCCKDMRIKQSCFGKDLIPVGSLNFKPEL